MPRALMLALALAMGLAATGARAQVLATETLTVATREAPPFAMRDADGKWSGISIALWEHIARDLQLDYRFEEASLADMIDGVEDGRYDAAVAALTITPEREAVVDFSHPFYTTGFGLAVSQERVNWLGMLFGLLSWQFLQAVLLLAAVIAVVGFLFWLFERKRNADEFGGKWWKGLGSGFWLSAVTMTTVGYGDKAPRTPSGRAVALVWMFTAIIITSTFTGMIASALTADRISGSIRGPDDLPKALVGSIQGSASEIWLAERRVNFRNFDTVAQGMDAVADGRIDVFVYDKPLLQYLAADMDDGETEVLSGTFGRQDYGIALPQGSPMREAVNNALLTFLETEDWDALTFRYLGEEE
ncbi:ABC transporter substrate-binding protein [Aquibium oceanicum]|uniref:ABC transporter substrate-binding protein n=2 Tax=Aquibium oceanicum TaxID=1670800 RepID=A0A1L3SSG9_9HYPH|nr:ABC transporter substrate-binding protein [Aquibium oceanicum]